MKEDLGLRHWEIHRAEPPAYPADEIYLPDDDYPIEEDKIEEEIDAMGPDLMGREV